MFRKIYDNLLLEMDILCHFKGLALCNAKRLQFHQNKNKISTQDHSLKGLIFPYVVLFLIDGVVGYVCVSQKNLIETAPLSSFMVAG